MGSDPIWLTSLQKRASGDRPREKAMWRGRQGWSWCLYKRRDAKGCPPTPRSWEKDQELILTHSPCKEQTCQHPDLWTSSLEPWKNLFPCFPPPSLWYFMTSAPADKRAQHRAWRRGLASLYSEVSYPSSCFLSDTSIAWVFCFALAAPHNMWDLSSQTRKLNLRPWDANLNHWTTREVQIIAPFLSIYLKVK